MASDLLTARAQAARECAAFYVAELRGAGLPAFREQLAADLAERTLELGGPFDALTDAYDKALRIAEGTEAALRDVLAQTERERDALAAKVTRYLAAYDADQKAGSAVSWATYDAFKIADPACARAHVEAAFAARRKTRAEFEAAERVLREVGCCPQPPLDAAARCEGVLR